MKETSDATLILSESKLVYVYLQQAFDRLWVTLYTYVRALPKSKKKIKNKVNM